MIKPWIYRGTLRFDRLVSHLPPINGFRPLRGSFSAWEHLNTGKLEGATIATGQTPGPCAAGSITERSAMLQHDHQPWPVFWTRCSDARLVGRMLHWRDPADRLCAEGVFHMLHRRKLSEDKFFAQIMVKPPVRLPGAWMSIASNWADGRNYFHWLLDGLTRLHVREHLPEETRILIPANSAPFVAQTIEMLGLSGLTVTAPASCVQPERFYFCSPTSMSGVWNPMGFDWLRGKFANFCSPSANGRPIFITRRGKTRVPANIAEIEAHFSESGFEIVDCGSIPVNEQMRLASAAPAIAGLHGAAMTNLLWAAPGTPVLEIFQNTYLNACYEQIAFQGKLAYSATILDQGSPLPTINSWLKTI